MWTWYWKRPSSRWLILFILSAIFFTLSLWYQASSFAYDEQHQLWKDYEILDIHNDPVAKLTVGYPAQVQFSEAVTTNSVLVWLQLFSSTTFPLTSTFTVTFVPFDEDIVFADDKGLPTRPQVELSAGNQSSRLIYLQLRPQAKETLPTTIAVQIEGQRNVDIPRQEAMTITPAIESRDSAWQRRIGELLFGPTAAIFAGVAILANLGLQQWLEYEKDRREKEDQKQVKLSQVKYLRVLVEQDVTLAIQQWYDYNKKNQQELEWQISEIKAELEEIWRIIDTHPWQRALLEKAIDYFEQKDLNAAKKFAELSEKLSLNKETKEIISTRFLAAHPDHQKLEVEIKAIGVENVIKSLLWLHQEFGEEVKSIVILPLVKLARDPKSIQVLDVLFASSLDGQKLLKEPEFDEALEDLIANPNAPPEAREIAKRLSVQRQEMYRWPKLWPVIRPAETPQLNSWLHQAGLSYNPFGPEQAELDSNLPEHRVYPSIFETSLRGARPIIVFGAPRSGKTASALLVAFDCANPPANPRERGAFPIYLKLRPSVSAIRTHTAYLELLVQAISRALINFFALNPFSFLEQSSDNRAVLAYLLLYSTGSIENLTLRLAQAGLPQESVGQRLIAEIADRGKIGPKLPLLDEQTWLELLQKARPAEFSYIYFLIDVTNDEISPANAGLLSQQLHPLISLVIPLCSVSVYVKLFMLEILQQHLTIPPDITVDKLTWSPDKLKELLQARLSKAAGKYMDLSQLFDSQSRSPDPTNRLINAANGSPQQLIRLGNQLLKAHIRQTPNVPELSYQDLESIFDTTNST